MIDAIKHACLQVTKDSLTASELAQHLGTPTRDLGGTLQIFVQPSDAAFTEAQVIRLPASQEPASVELRLRAPEGISVSALRTAFGEYSEPPRLHPGAPRRIIFYPPLGEKELQCAIIALVTPGASGVADGKVHQLTLRRDRFGSGAGTPVPSAPP